MVGHCYSPLVTPKGHCHTALASLIQPLTHNKISVDTSRLRRIVHLMTLKITYALFHCNPLSLKIRHVLERRTITKFSRISLSHKNNKIRKWYNVNAYCLILLYVAQKITRHQKLSNTYVVMCFEVFCCGLLENTTISDSN